MIGCFEMFFVQIGYEVCLYLEKKRKGVIKPC